MPLGSLSVAAAVANPRRALRARLRMDLHSDEERRLERLTGKVQPMRTFSPKCMGCLGFQKVERYVFKQICQYFL
jgi:hypothetical protein